MRRWGGFGLAVLLAAAPVRGRAQEFASDSAWLASKGFDQRAADALLHGGRDSIRSLRVRSVSDLLERVPRVELKEVGGGERVFVLHRTGSWRGDASDDGCLLPVYLNGARFHAGSGSAATVRAVDRAVKVREVDGVEVFGPEASPVGEGDACGSVLLWSRRHARTVNEEFIGRLRGRAVWSPEGTPAGDIAIRMEPGGLEQSTDSGGWFEFGRLLPGRYRITATAPDGASWTGDLIVPAFAISQLEIEVSRREEGR